MQLQPSNRPHDVQKDGGNASSKITPCHVPRPGTYGLLLALSIIAILCMPALSPPTSRGAVVGPARADPLAGTLLIHVVRTGPAEASVLGVAVTVSDLVEVLVDSTVVRTTVPVWNLDYWALHVPVADASMVQTRIGLLTSPSVPVPAYVPQPVAPPGFIYAQGAKLMLNGAPIQLSGVDEQTSFLYGLIASGLLGYPNPGAEWGKNQLFPSGPATQIPGVTTPDELWREFFRYFLHYQQTSSEPYYPRPNLLRVWIVDPAFGSESTYDAWASNPTMFWEVFDRMVYWADRAGVYLAPVLGHAWGAGSDVRYFDTTSLIYQHHVDLVRAIMARYNDNPRIAMWDVWNEADVNNDAYWASVGGITAYKAWATRYIGDVKPSSSNHLITMGHAGWTLFPGVPAFGWQYFLFFNEIPGLQVSHSHIYMTAEDPYLIDWQTQWHEALGIPHYVGEFGYNVYPGPSPYGYGYWPWFSQQTRAAGWPAITPMVWWDNGRGPFSDYAYTGALPAYPSPTGFDFTLSLNPSSATVNPGQSVTSMVTATRTGTTPDIVNFTASGLPSGAGAAFTPTGCSPTCASTLTITTSGSTPAGAYPITVTGTGGGLTRTATFSLTVSVPCPTAPPSFAAGSWDRVWCDSAFTNKLADLPDEPVEKFDNSWARGVVAGGRSDDVGFRSGRTLALPTTGTYAFTVGSDDGVRVWVDGTLALDKWFQQPYTLYNFTLALSAGSHAVQIDWFDLVFDARVSFTYTAPPAPDTTPPAATTNLAATATGTQTIVTQWTAPGDDGTSGTATAYDLRYSSVGPIDDTNFGSATPVTTPAPKTPGSLESFTVVGLTPSTRYWFALKTSDEVPNWSPLSNVVDAVTWTPPPPPDTTPPARITDLGVTVTGTQSVSLHWTAPGDDGTAGTATSYDARYSSSGPLTDANFASGTSIATPMPGLAGTSETVNLGGLTPSTRYWFAIRTRDEVPNWALISNVPDATTQTLPDTTLPTVGITTPVNGATVSGNVQVTASAADNVAVASVDLYVDGAFFASSLSPPYAWVWPSVGLSEGAHLLRAMATDTSGNQQNASANVDVRNAVPTPPTVLSAGWDANRSWVEIEFSQPMNRTSVEANLATSPIAEHTVLWANDSHLFVALTGPITPGTKYTVMISIGARDTQGTGMAEGFTYEFIPSPQASSENPWYLIELLLVLSLIITSVGVLSTRHRVNALDRASARRTH